MGKVGEEQPIPTSVSAQNAENCCRIKGLFGFRCVFVLLLGVAVLLSAVFWLPPFFSHGDRGDLDLASLFRDHYIVAAFNVGKPVSVLEDNIMQLQDDIFDEIGVPATKVEVISLKPYAGSNVTKVIFAVDPDVKGAKLNTAAKSLIKASFASLVINQSSLRLTTSLFGDPSSFDVLKFVGGITVIPPQRAFLLQTVQILFNFTLNFSIDQIQDNFSELTSQLKSGLHLAPYENLYISLTNQKGSTVVSPTTVQSLVLLAVGNTPSLGRLKQLAQTITGSPTKNLGLNNTVFGKVKQVSLSSILQHSLHGSDGSPSPSPALSPQPPDHHHHQHHHYDHSSPAPVPEPYQHHHHGHRRRHHHHHRRHDHDVHISPALSPVEGGSTSTTGSPASAPSPANKKSHVADPPGCQNGYRNRPPRNANKHSHIISPAAPPTSAHHISPSPQQVKPPARVPHLIPSSSPLPHVVYSHRYPPPTGGSDTKSPDWPPSISPSQSSCSLPSHNWWILLFPVLVLHL
ncbi:hypothetical protein DCAR_0519314 [Daucus carota subsp. sativus]|uniref:DUF7036 domain-containing protein n=1 Tax=Daucus carota subsp. sativus TaxID=79200 RepID=A0AAF1AYE7_DAUCS|nr:PREDICTED: wiskott-Aldrich syndrome protein homolog 1 isoform X2 [Daucus carota subsp. sativus]WOG99958.1 hypothetical protein DCAR_0519314 [Daucus carota subsp. sativus]